MTFTAGRSWGSSAEIIAGVTDLAEAFVLDMNMRFHHFADNIRISLESQVTTMTANDWSV